MADYEYKYGEFSARFAKLILCEDRVASDEFTGIRYDFLITGMIVEKSAEDFARKFHEIRNAVRQRSQRFLVKWSSDNFETSAVLYDMTSNRDPGAFFVTKFISGSACEYVWAISIFKSDK